MLQSLPMTRAPVLIALLVAAFLAQESLATRFSGHRDHVNNLLGSSDLADLNLQTGFVDFSESRLNIYGERSSVFYHLKPHTTKLKVRVDHSCFEIKCSTGKFFLIERSDRSASRDELDGDCLHSSVSALTSSAHMTGRSLTYSQKRPSLNDVRSGDLLHGDMKCRDATPASGSFKIASIYQQSDTSIGSTKRIYEMNVLPAVITDIVSEGEYEFHTENLLTVNELEHPHARDPSFHARKLNGVSSETFSKDLVNLVSWRLRRNLIIVMFVIVHLLSRSKFVSSSNRIFHRYCTALHQCDTFYKFCNNSFVLSQNWNFNQERGAASTSINLWNRQGTLGRASVDCVSCYAQFKASAVIKYRVEYGVKWEFWVIPVPFVDIKFMAEVSIRAIANIDLKFFYDYAYTYEYSRKLASITPMLDQALGGFNILGFPLTLGITYGLDITVGVTFAAKADLQVTVGADVQCNYKFGVYHNYPRPNQPNGCSRSYHKPAGWAAGSIEVIY